MANAEAQKSHLFTQMLHYYIVRIQPVAGLIYSVLLVTTDAHDTVSFPIYHSQWS